MVLLGKIVSATAAGAGTVTVTHGLGYKPNAAFVISCTAAVVVVPDLDAAGTDAQNLVVRFGGAGTAKLWVV